MQSPRALQDFETTIRDVVQSTVNPLRVEFDIYLLDTDPAQQFILAGYQAGIHLNPGIFPAGATISVSIFNNATYSQLIPSQQPTAIEYDPSVNDN